MLRVTLLNGKASAGPKLTHNLVLLAFLCVSLLPLYPEYSRVFVSNDSVEENEIDSVLPQNAKS